MVGQGGPLQAALTSKELRELSRLRGCQPQLCREDFNAIGRLVDSKHKTECLYGLQPHALCCTLRCMVYQVQFPLSTAELCMTYMTCLVYRFAQSSQKIDPANDENSKVSTFVKAELDLRPLIYLSSSYQVSKLHYAKERSSGDSGFSEVQWNSMQTAVTTNMFLVSNWRSTR